MAYVPNDGLREAFLTCDVAAHEIALRLGYTRPRYGRAGRFGDADAVRRALGLKPCRPRAGLSPTRQRFMREATAIRFCSALNVDPVDVGL